MLGASDAPDADFFVADVFGRMGLCLSFALVVILGDNWFAGVLQG